MNTIVKELLATAKEVAAERRRDNTGKPIRPIEHYVLAWKLSGYGTRYFMDGSIHSPQFTEDIYDAFEFTGAKLMDMAYDWTMNWNAVSVKFL